MRSLIRKWFGQRKPEITVLEPSFPAWVSTMIRDDSPLVGYKAIRELRQLAVDRFGTQAVHKANLIAWKQFTRGDFEVPSLPPKNDGGIFYLEKLRVWEEGELRKFKNMTTPITTIYGIRVAVDSTLPEGTIEIRNADGDVLSRIENVTMDDEVGE